MSPTTSTTSSDPVSKKALWTGRVLSALPVLLLVFSGAMKFTRGPGLAEGLQHLGIPLERAPGLGVLELACTLLYVIPRTAVLGAILLTGYIGGAMAIHLRVGDAVVTHILFGILIWGGVYLRDPRLRALIPLRR